jgi:hypothetical protein
MRSAAGRSTSLPIAKRVRGARGRLPRPPSRACGAYDRVAEVLLAMRPSYELLDDRAGFDQLVDEVRRSYRRRRLLLERLDRAGLVTEARP